MTVFDHLPHILRLTLFWWRREKRSETLKTAFVPSDDSITTPLGYIPHFRNVDTNASLSDGIEKARNRSYAARECKRLNKR